MICSVKAEALSNPEQEPTLSENAESGRHEGCGMLDPAMLEKAPHWLNKAWC